VLTRSQRLEERFKLPPIPSRSAATMHNEILQADNADGARIFPFMCVRKSRKMGQYDLRIVRLFA
jgi:hypothetical protein